MPRIGLSEGWTRIPEGIHVLKITKVSYKENFGKLEITMKTVEGQSHIERFYLLKKNHESNEGALNAFSYFARAAMNDYEVADIDPEELVGRYMRCTVEHEVVPDEDNPGKTKTYVHLVDKVSADGYDEPERASVAQKTSPPAPDTRKGAGKPAFDLDSLLS